MKTKASSLVAITTTAVIFLMMTIVGMVHSSSPLKLTTTLADDLFINSQYIQMEHTNQNHTSLQLIKTHYELKGWKRIHNNIDDTTDLHRAIHEKINSQMVHVTFALKDQAVDLLRRKAIAVSTPGHRDHENYLTMAQVAQYTKPSSEDYQAVMHYIKTIPGSIVLKVSKHENFIECLMPVSSINKYFKADMKPYHYKKSNTVLLRSLDRGYSLPKEIASSVSLISGLTSLPNMVGDRSGDSPLLVSKAPLDDGQITPQVIWKRYNISVPTFVSANSSQSVASFLQQYYSESDLAQFQSTFNLVRQSPVVYGPNDESNPGVEASLDIQYLMGVGYRIKTTFVSTPGVSNVTGQERFLAWVIQQQEMGDASPWVHSVSYGDDEVTVTRALADKLDTEFMKFAATGRTIMVASGDNGAQCNQQGTKFSPTWPNTSPWVTSVGATEPSSQYWEKSTGWSGGGFSSLYSRPQYQNDAVAAYLKGNNIPPTSYFNPSGRAYPDVSALGVNYQVFVSGTIQNVAGTSAASPCFAGVVSLINDARFKAGKKPIGFLNIFLYTQVPQTPNAFFDITQGYNSADPCQYGFPAARGYDAISGWGVPNFSVLRDLALKK